MAQPQRRYLDLGLALIARKRQTVARFRDERVTDDAAVGGRPVVLGVSPRADDASKVGVAGDGWGFDAEEDVDFVHQNLDPAA